MDNQRSGPGFELVSFLHPVNPPGGKFASLEVVNYDLHLIHALQGKGVLKVGAQQEQVEPEVVVFIPPGVSYSVLPDARLGLEMLNFHFHLFLDDGVAALSVVSLPNCFKPAGLKAIHRRLKGLHARYAKGGLERGMVAAELHRLTADYFRHFALRKPAPAAHPQMQRLHELLSRGDSPAFDARLLARSVFLSVSQMNRRFRADYGTSPKEFWLRQRFFQAQNQLLYGHEPIRQIATRLRFEDANYFSRWFTQLAGRSPRQFRAQTRAGSHQAL